MSDNGWRTGPLSDLRVIELGGRGPGPFGCMLLADMGADVIRIDRPESVDLVGDVVLRGRRSVVLDLKSSGGHSAFMSLIERSDVLVDPYRPSVLERMGLGPIDCWNRNRSLTVARVTGWGQDGPLAGSVGHDINYAAMSGLLHAVGVRGGDPVIPLNVGADGGGGWMLAFAILCGVREAQVSGIGQVVDVAMLDACGTLLAKWYGEFAAGDWHDERGVNRVDGGSHYYHVYPTADGRYLAVGAIEPAFYEAFVRGLGLDHATLPDQNDREEWPRLIEEIGRIILDHDLAHWLKIYDGVDACVTPVLSLAEAPLAPQARVRGTFIERDGVVQPAVAPRFQRTPGTARRIPSLGEHTEEVLAEVRSNPTRASP